MRTVDLNEISEFEKEFRRLRFNPIYFYEYYWNKSCMTNTVEPLSFRISGRPSSIKNESKS